MAQIKADQLCGLMNSIYLAVDTTTEACSVALCNGAESIFRYTEEPRMHANLVLPMVDQLLAEAECQLNQLKGIIFCRGPGAFTGLRIGAGVVQGLAFSADIPVMGVSTLATIAQRAYREHGARRVYAAIDARMGEVYWGAYLLDEKLSSSAMQLEGEELVVRPQQLSIAASSNKDWVGCGTGWNFANELAVAGVEVGVVYSGMLPHALDALTLGIPGLSAGKGVAPELAIPQYLRNNVAKKKAEQGPAS